MVKLEELADMPATEALPLEAHVFDYPGPEAMAAAGMGFYDPTRAKRDDFIVYRNPTEHTLSAVVEIGVEPNLQVRLYRAGFPRGRAEIGEREIRARIARGRPVHPSLCRVKVTIAPGDTITLPREWRSAIRTIASGRIVGGLIPQLLEEESGAENPPTDPRIVSEA